MLLLKLLKLLHSTSTSKVSMKRTLAIILATLSLSAFAQTSFKLTDSTRVEFDVCQVNHNIILDKFIKQTETQAAKLIHGIQIETELYTPAFKINSYKNVLTDIIIKRIIYSELKKQLNRENMKGFFAVKGNYNKPFLNDQAIVVDLNQHIPAALKQIKLTHNVKVAQDKLDDIKNDIIKDAALGLISKRYRQIGAGVFARILTRQTGKVATSQVLKSATVSLGSKLFISASEGLVIDLLTIPLHGYRLPPETLWTDLLDDYPELIIVPEWMHRGKIDDHAWFTHCSAIQRRTKLMDERFARALKIEEKEFIKRLIYINELVEEKTVAEKNPLTSYYLPIAVDNTYVKKPVIIKGSLPPYWAK